MSDSLTLSNEHASASAENSLSAGAASRSNRPSGNTRRDMLRTLGKVGIGAAFIGVSSLARPRTVRAQSMAEVEALNFALLLEYLEAEYYEQGLGADGLLSGEAREVYERISQHEDEHVALLQTALGDAALAREDVTFDFTGARGGANDPLFSEDPFSNYDLFLQLSQGFEDTGVRAYKGQAANVSGSLVLAGLNILTTALQIHSVEGRHAAEVRRLRALNGTSGLQPWVHEDGATDGGPLEAIYDGEDNTTQVVDLLSALNGDYSDEQIREAFDEPLTMDEVLDIAQLFVVQDLGVVLAGEAAPPIVAADFENGILSTYTTDSANNAEISLNITDDVPPTNGGSQALRVDYEYGGNEDGNPGGYAFFRFQFEEIIDISVFDDPYLNFYVKSPATLPDDFRLEVNLEEDQELTGEFDGNGPVDDEFQTLYFPSNDNLGDEYQLVSLPFSEFTDDDGPFGDPGAGDSEFSDLVRVLLINVYPLPVQTFELYFDYFVFSEGPLGG